MPSYDTDGWESVTLSHDWQVGLPFDPDALSSAGCKPRDPAWYQLVLPLKRPKAGRQYLLLLEGVANECEVYFNGSRIARNHSAYEELTADVTDVLQGDQPNVLACR